MSKHTQGPWEARQSVRGYWFIEHQQGGEGYTLTKLDCGEEDSRLIASAPEMLAALMAAKSEMHYFTATRGSEAHELVRAAIAKATGEEI